MSCVDQRFKFSSTRRHRVSDAVVHWIRSSSIRWPVVLLLCLSSSCATQEWPESSDGRQDSWAVSLHRISPTPTLNSDQQAGMLCKNDLIGKTKGWKTYTDEDVKAYLACKAKYYGLQDGLTDSQLLALLATLETEPANVKPTDTQRQQIKQWSQDRSNLVGFKWSKRYGTLRSAEGMVSSLLPGDPSAAIAAAAAELLPRINLMCEDGASTSWVLEKHLRQNDASVWQATYRRNVSGLPVRGEFLELTHGLADGLQVGRRVHALSLRCRRGSSFSGMPPTSITKDQAISVALASVALETSGAVAKNATLVVTEFGQGPRPTWIVDVAGQSKHVAVWVDASAGSAVKSLDQTFHSYGHSGSLKMTVRQANTIGTVVGGFPYGNVYEEDKEVSLLGQTDRDGSYSISSHPNWSDHLWEVYLRGAHVSQQGSGSPLNLVSFAADGGTTYSAMSSESDQRLVEMYYTLNFTRDVTTAAFSALPTLQPVTYLLDLSYPSTSCNAATDAVFGIRFFGTCQGYSDREARLRWMHAHEWGHTNRIASGNNPTCGTNGHLCAAWEEGRADYTAYVTNRMEFLRASASSSCGSAGGSSCSWATNDQFYPDDRYPESECTCDPHDTGNVFAGVYNDLHHEIGWKKATQLVMESIDSEIDDQTAWVDSSTDENDFYHHMLVSDIELTNKKWQLAIGQAWKRHDSSLQPSAWDWQDQWPDSPASTYMITPSTTQQAIADGPDSFLPNMALDYRTDEDYVFFYAQEGTTYSFTTQNLCSGVDTIVDVIHISNGVEIVDESNDDCPGYGLASCVDFTASDPGWHAVKARSYLQSSEGCYELTYVASDDTGNNPLAARPMAIDGSAYDGEWEVAGDTDYFKIYVPDSGSGVNLTVSTCEVSPGADTVITLYHESNLLTEVASNNDSGSQSCGVRSSRITYEVPAGKSGFYFVKVTEFGNDSTGTWQISATLEGNDDVGGSGMSTALPVSNDPITGRSVSGHFDAGTDEDWFVVSLNANEHATFHVVDLHGGADTVMSVFDDGLTAYEDIPAKNGVDVSWLLQDDDGGAEWLASRIHLVAPRTGNYFVRLSPFSSYSLGAYTLYVQRDGLFEEVLPSYP